MAILLSRSDVARLLDMGEVIDIMKGAFSDLATENAVLPQRTPIPVPDHSGVALFMPAYLKGMGALGAKMVTVYKDNMSLHNLPTVLGTIALMDEQTGAPVALMDGGYLTAMRTGAVSGLATRLLARKNAELHALFGTGGMARAQAWAVDCARDIRKLILFSVDPKEKREAFRDSLRDIMRCEIALSDDPQRAVAEADILTLITSAKDPVIDGDWLKPGTHINGIGSHAPKMREIDSKTVAKAKIVCDLVEACKAEAGDFMIPAEKGEWSWDRVHGSLGDVVSGKIPGRVDDSEITLFKSVGLAVQDISTAHYVYQKAKREGIGTNFDFMR
jgi:alanine dehydrogenase